MCRTSPSDTLERHSDGRLGRRRFQDSAEFATGTAAALPPGMNRTAASLVLAGSLFLAACPDAGSEQVPDAAPTGPAALAGSWTVGFTPVSQEACPVGLVAPSVTLTAVATATAPGLAFSPAGIAGREFGEVTYADAGGGAATVSFGLQDRWQVSTGETVDALTDLQVNVDAARAFTGTASTKFTYGPPDANGFPTICFFEWTVAGSVTAS
jgi:hypothetical protein